MNENSSSTFIAYFHKYVCFAANDFELFTRTLNGSVPMEFKPQSKEAAETTSDFGSLNLDDSSSSKLVNGLVDYSSSDDDSQYFCIKYGEFTEGVMSCLIRLHLKLDRLASKGLLPDNLHPLSEPLEKLEEKYES